MEYGIYINDCLHFRSANKENCIAKGLDIINEEWQKNKNNIPNITKYYINSVADWTTSNFPKINFNRNNIEVKEIKDKKFSIIYSIDFEECADTLYSPYISTEKSYICYEDKVGELYEQLRNELESNIVDCGYKNFDDMLGDTIECLQDNNFIYEVFDKRKKQFHRISLTQII